VTYLYEGQPGRKPAVPGVRKPDKKK
jgi:hypothetical protein